MSQWTQKFQQLVFFINEGQNEIVILMIITCCAISKLSILRNILFLSL